jgi:2'-5' RNA ligase
MRIFIGIDLDPEVRARIERFLDGVQGLAPDARWVRPESLHITLKFIGEQKPEQVDALSERLQLIVSEAFDFRVEGYGFFPTATAPRVFWIGIDGGAQLTKLAASVDALAADFGIAREDRPYSPHLTLARAGGRSGSTKWRASDAPNNFFAALEKRLSAMSEMKFGTMRPTEFVLYQSQPSAGGSKYTKLKRFALGSHQRKEGRPTDPTEAAPHVTESNS